MANQVVKIRSAEIASCMKCPLCDRLYREATTISECLHTYFAKVTDDKECIKFKTDQAQDVKKMQTLNNIFFTMTARGPEVDIAEVTGKEQAEAQPAKKGRGRKQ